MQRLAACKNLSLYPMRHFEIVSTAVPGYGSPASSPPRKPSSEPEK